MGGQVHLLRKPTGAKIAPGATNFMERNRERLAAAAQRSKDRADARNNSQNNSQGRANSYERRNQLSGPRNNSTNRNPSNDSRNAR